MRTRSTAGPDWTWRKAFALALALACVLMVFSFARVITPYGFLFWDDKVLASVVGVPLWGTRLGAEVFAFVAAQLLVHGTFGALVWLLARASEYGFRPQRTGRRELVLAWFLLLAIAAVVANAWFMPWSGLGESYADAVSYEVAGVAIAQVVLVATGLTVLATLGAAAARSFTLPATPARAWVVACLLVVGLGGAAEAFVSYRRTDDGVRAAATSRPNVILIGIDSLRPDHTVLGGDKEHAPNVNAFLREAHVFRDTTTPLARTFPAWMSILTGRHPHDTGALMNLTDRSVIRAHPTLADVLRREGYRTAFAIDEVRFANIDESFGFDEVVTPPMGAGDFLFGALNDAPLANLLADTRLGRWLFPHSHANRAAAAVYRPASFMRRLEAELELPSPFFLAVHFTLPHYPYHWADAPRYKDDGTAHYGQTLYGETVRRADAQVGELLGMLRSRGALENAIVVLLSDHGEALGRPEDVLLTDATREVDGYLIPAMAAGHGTSVLSPPQYQVVLGVRGYGAAALSELPPATFDTPASLEDVMPTLLELLGISVADAQFSGVSLAGILGGRQPDGAAPAEPRIRFTETEFNPPALMAGFAAEQEIAKQSAQFYQVHPDTGRLTLRSAKLAEAMADRQYSAIGDDHVLAAMPVAGGYRYVLVARDRSEVRVLAGGADELQGDPQVLRLWEALHRRFDLEPAARVVAGTGS